MKTSRNHNRGSVESSARSQKFKNKKSSLKKEEQISKYFSKKACNQDSNRSDCSDQHDLTGKSSEIKFMSKDDDSKDFMTPKPIKIKKKVQAKLSIVNPKSKAKTTKSQNPLFQDTKDNFGVLDMNPDHLQMALALSKSTYAVEYPELSKDAEDSFPTFLTPEKIPKGKTTLEKYGFKSDKSKLLTGFRRDIIEVPKKKNSKFRFVTPTLKTRTMDERTSIITAKISLILCSAQNFTSSSSEEDQVSRELWSDVLKNYKGNYSLFAVNGFSLQENDKYYNKNLNISPTKSKCGCLLKKWEDITGRERSPDRNILKSRNINEVPLISLTSTGKAEPDVPLNNTSLTNINCNLSAEYEVKRDCISPDLFESDVECDDMPKSLSDELEFSQSLLSPSKKHYSLTSPSCSSNYIDKRVLNDTDLEMGGTDTYFHPSKNCSTENICYDFNRPNLSQIKENNGTVKTLKEVTILDDDEDTEKLYSSFCKDEEHINLTQNSPPRNDQGDEDDERSSVDFKKRQEDFVVDLTFSSSSNDSSSHFSSGKNCENSESEINLDNDDQLNTNFDMSPLVIKNSEDYSTNCNLESKKTTDTDQSMGFDDFNVSLNVTDYVNQILNQNDSKINKSNTDSMNLMQEDKSNNISLEDEFGVNTLVKDNSKTDSDNELSLSQKSSSQESIVISDEELNYSSIHSKGARYDRNFYNLSDLDDTENFENDKDLPVIDDVYTIHSELRNKYGIKNISSPVHNRISELKNTTLKNSNNRKPLQDSFDELLENSNRLKVVENETNQIPPTDNGDSQSTPEKVPSTSPVVSNTTPENNLIIKTSNVTPLADYDAMDTPKITKELQKFGLKPLKRQRGVKLLKYLYESTHPLVAPETEELSSDEDDQIRVTRKRRKINDTVKIGGANLICDQENIEIVGDSLLKNENFDELIFERKFSVKIPSCRIPLQIVWHNFLSKNEHIKENILLYEPLQLEVLHTMIKEQTGCKFHIQDLLTFFDRKCITIRTAQGCQKGKRKT